MSSTQVVFSNNVNAFGFLIIIFFIIEILVFIAVLVYQGRTYKVRREHTLTGDMTLWNLHLVGFVVKLASVLLICTWFFVEYQQIDPRLCTTAQSIVCDKTLILRNFGVVMAFLVVGVTTAAVVELVVMKKIFGYNKKTSEN